MKWQNYLIRFRIKLEGIIASRIVGRDAKNVEKTQAGVLQRIISRAKKTEYGQKFNFDRILTVGDYQENVPVNDYESLRPWIEKQDQTGTLAINPSQPLMYAVTSGTTGNPKYIPILEETLKRQKRITHLFLYRLLQDRPRLFDGSILSIVSPAVEGRMPVSGRPFGSTSGHMYEGIPGIIQSKYVVPAKIFSIENYETKYLAIIQLAIARGDLTFLTTANPSTLARIAKIVNEHFEDFVSDLEKGEFKLIGELNAEQQTAIQSRLKADPLRASMLRQVKAAKGNLKLKDLWPDLQVVSCWTGGSSSIFLDQLKYEFPEQTIVRDLGYLSSEFRGTIPLSSDTNAGIPTFRSNFFEFVKREDWDQKRPSFLGLHQLENKEQYYIFVTSDSGLFRYDMNDVVEVDGFYHSVPRLRFLQNGKGVTNITGEKLYENQAIQCVNQVESEFSTQSSFFILSADEKVAIYKLYYEPAAADLETAKKIALKMSESIDQALRDINIEYDTKRNSGRIKPLELVVLQHGTYEAYKKSAIARGQREGQFKIIALQYEKDLHFNFSEHKA